MEALSNILKQLTRTTLWCAITLMIFAATVGLVLMNYMGNVSALERLNYEMRPLYTDLLFGPLLGAFLGDLMMVHCLSFLVAFGEAMAVFFACSLVRRAFHLLEGRSLHRVRNDEQQVAAYTRQLRKTGVELGFWLVLAAGMVCWEIFFFRFRSIADAQNMRTAAEALKLPEWSVISEQYSGMYFYQAARWGGYFFAMLVVLFSSGLEYSIERLGESVSVLGHDLDAALRQLWSGMWRLGGEDFGGSVSAGPQQMQLHSPEASQLKAGMESYSETVGGNPEPEIDTATAPDAADRKERVVVGRRDSTITAREAMEREDEYYINPHTQEIYDRAYWELLHANHEQEKKTN